LKIKRYLLVEQELTVYMVHHGVLVLVVTSQEIAPFLELLEGLLVGCAFLLKKTA